MELLSIIIPVLNEEENIPLMADQLTLSLKGENYELLFIDDGSTDGTLAAIKKLRETVGDLVRYVSFSRNFGHQNALKAGFAHAKGDCIITLDGDMQHPPELIPQMLALWRNGADVVNTSRQVDPNLPKLKKLTSCIFYKIFDLLTDVPIEPNTADFRLVDRKVAIHCAQSCEDVFFWRALIPWMGFKQESISYCPNIRTHGTTKYSLKKMLRLAWSGLSSFSLLPLRASFLLSALAFLFALAYLIYVLVVFFSGTPVPGWSSLLVVMLFFGAVQLLCLGVIGEYVGKTYLQSKRRPPYIVNEVSLDMDNREN